MRTPTLRGGPCEIKNPAMGHPEYCADQSGPHQTAECIPAEPSHGGGEPRPGARAQLCVRERHCPRVRKLRGAARRSRDRRGLHLVAEQPPCRMDDQGGRRGQARVVREAACDARRRGGRGRRCCQAQWRRGRRGVHVSPPPSNPEGSRADRQRRHRRPPAHPRWVHLLQQAPKQRAPGSWLGGGSIWDLGCYPISYAQSWAARRRRK